MYCPNCGKDASLDQKFCRSCGLSLEKTVESLVTVGPERRPKASVPDSDQKLGLLWQLGCFASFGAMSLIALSVIYLIFTIYIPEAIRRGSVVGVMVSTAVLLFVVSLVLIAPYLYYKRFHKNARGRSIVEPENLLLSDAATRRLSEAHLEPINSVTDRTTDLIEVDRKSRESGD